jgi:hypothetical protein
MNTYSTSDGERLAKSTIDARIRKAKQQFLEDFRDEHGYHFCEHCKRSDKTLSCSHIVSVDQCQKAGMSEISYDVNDLELLCLSCHAKAELLSESQKWDIYYGKK